MTPDFASLGYVNFLFAVFCAWWAMHSGRNPWLWFLLGWLLSVLAALLLLYRSGQDRARSRNHWLD